MADHVQDDAAAVFLAVVPARSLDRLQVALEHPITKLDTHRQDTPKEAGAFEHVEFAQAGQEEFVLNHAVFEA